MHKQEELIAKYKEWYLELPENLRGDGFSNPNFAWVPDKWETAKNKIMVIGEEGYGKWGCGKKCGWRSNEPSWNAIEDIEEIIQYNRDVVLSQTEYFDKIRNADTSAWKEINPDHGETYDYDYNSAFWNRFHAIYALDSDNISLIWNNLNKIHSVEYKGSRKYQLTTKQTKALHSTKIKIIKEEIDILRPTMIVFFGWYYNALNLSMCETCKELYLHKYGENGWKNTKLWDEITYTYPDKTEVPMIFTYHPAYQSKTYENKVVSTIEKFLIK